MTGMISIDWLPYFMTRFRGLSISHHPLLKLPDNQLHFVVMSWSYHVSYAPTLPCVACVLVPLVDVGLDRIDQEEHVVEGRRGLRNIVVARRNTRPRAALGVTVPSFATSIRAAEGDVDNLLDISWRKDTAHWQFYNLHLFPRIPNVAVLRHEAHYWRASLAWVRIVALHISRNGRLREVPDLNAICFNLSSPNTATVLVEGVTEGAIRSNDAAASDDVIAVGAEDVTGTVPG